MIITIIYAIIIHGKSLDIGGDSLSNERVRFFDSNDMMYGYKLDKIATMSVPNYSEIDINDAIEFYEIKRYFDNGVRSQEWNDEEYEKYRNKADKLYALTLRLFNCLCDNNIVDEYNKIERNYKNSFWLLFDTCKLYNQISVEVFNTLIHSEHVSFRHVFSHRNIVNKYGDILKSFIFEKEYGIPFLLEYYEQDYQLEKKLKLYLPKELSGDDVCSYLDSYCDSEQPNPNYLESIADLQENKKLPISDELKLKALRKYKEVWKKLDHTGAHFETSIQLGISKEQEEPFIDNSEGLNYKLSYSEKYLLDTLDHPNILNNFIYLFDYVDVRQQRCAFLSTKARAGVIESVFRKHTKRHYLVSFAFNIINAISTLQMQSYYEFLEMNGVQFENVLHWFFTSYLQEEFSCSEMRLSFPTKSSSYAEKCSNILTTFDAAIKQFTKYVQNGEIDFELIQMSTKPIAFESIPSLNEGKYVYGKGKIFNGLCSLMFSDQSMIHFVERIHKQGKNYENFLELIRNENVYLSDYPEFDIPSLETLKRYELIIIDENSGLITAGNNLKIVVLYDLYINEFINKYHYPKRYGNVFKEFIDLEMIEEKNTLFSRQEINYLNYMLNRSEYCNGLEIRNKYVHGNQHVNPNEEEHRRNYYILLKLFVLLAIKINDDFCIRYPEKDEKEQ